MREVKFIYYSKIGDGANKTSGECASAHIMTLQHDVRDMKDKVGGEKKIQNNKKKGS